MKIGTSPQITRETTRPLRFAARQRAKITGRLPESPAVRLLRSCAVPSGDCSGCSLGRRGNLYTNLLDEQCRPVQCVHVEKRSSY